jgi:anti-sigma factor (TIGR02949 family)
MWHGSVDLFETECDEILRDLEAYLDGELARNRAVLVETHLRTCSPCFAHGEFRRRVRIIIRSKCGGAVDLPPHLAERVRRAIRAEPPR